MIRSNAFVFAAVALGVTFGTGVASAADLPARPYTKAPPLQPVPVTWSGCYLGGNIGAGWDRFSAGEVGFAGVPTPFVDYGSNTGSSFIGGGQIGCDYQFASNWVIGIQGKTEFGSINSSNPVAAFPGVTAVFKLKNTETLTVASRLHACADGACLCQGRRGLVKFVCGRINGVWIGGPPTLA